jgi:general secretion pathway protein M
MRAAIEHAGPTARDNAALQDELARLKQRKVIAIGLLESPNESLAAVALQDRVKAAVGTVHGDLRSTQVLAARDEGKFRRIAIRGEVTVDIAGLQRVLYDLEAGSPLLFLDNVEIRVPERPRGAGAVENSNLDMRFDLYGYIAKPT